MSNENSTLVSVVIGLIEPPMAIRRSSPSHFERAIRQSDVMNIYSTFVAIHVTTAVLGLGPLVALAIITIRPSAGEFPSQRATQFLRLVGWSLAGMLMTGAILLELTKGVFSHMLWLRASLVLFMLLGFLLGYARRLLRRAAAATPPVIPTALSQILWAMCAVVAAIIFLMETKLS